MKTLIHILLLLILLIDIKVNAQISEKVKNPFELSEQVDINPDPVMSAILDSVYPGVKYIVKYYPGQMAAYIFFIRGNDSIQVFYGDEKDQQTEVLSTDSIFRYSDITLVNSFIFIDIIRRQGDYYKNNGLNIKCEDIKIISGFKDLSYSQERKYRRMDSTMKYINMKVEVNLDPTKKYRCAGGYFYASKAYYEFQFFDGILAGCSVETEDLKGQIHQEGFYPFSGCNVKIAKKRYTEIREQKKKNSSILTPVWTSVYLLDDQNLETRTTGPSGKSSLHLTLETDGVFTTGSTRFYVTGNDITDGYELRIYSDPDFHSASSLIFQSQLNKTSSSSAETNTRYAPVNNDIDGFCLFQIWKDGSMVTEFPNRILILQRTKTDNTYSKPLKIYYAKSFFYNHPSGTSICNTYITKVVNNYNEVWNKEVIEYNINNSTTPVSYNGNFEVSINPFQEATNYIFQFDYENKSCFYAWQIHHIGITANPALFLPTISLSAIYSEDEFIKIEIAHEFYHQLQESLNSSMPSSDKKTWWLIEGQARAIQSIIYPEIEYKSDYYGDFAGDANSYILNYLKSSWIVGENPYAYSLFWRFLYENYNPTGTIQNKLAIFRETCIGFTATTIPALETFMNSKLNSTTYPTMDAAVTDFSKRVLFNDPETDPNNNLWEPCISAGYYAQAEYGTDLNFDKVTTDLPGGGVIPSAYGMQFEQIYFKNKGNAFINFNGDLDGDGLGADFAVNLVFVDDPTHKDNFIPVSTAGTATCEVDIASSNTYAFLIITRVDNDETQTGTFNITVSPSVPSGVLKANLIKSPGKSLNNQVTVNTSVSFQDLSVAGNFPIVNWEWKFSGGTPNHFETTNGTNPPQILYTDPGVYPVTLIVTDASGAKDTKTINDCIVVYEPAGGTGGNLEVSGNNPSFGFKGQILNFNLFINTGTPPFKVAINYGDGTTDSEVGYFDLIYNKFHQYSTNGNYTVTYTVIDALENIGTDSWDISIGMPGDHNVNFYWTVPGNSSTIGTDVEVSFHDQTEGGYQPYIFWEWVYGAGINTGSYPENTNGYPWEIRWNTPPNNSFNGNPLFTVKFPAYDIYPITLTVTDQAGFQNSTTQYLKVSAVEKCFCFESWMINHYNANLNKHIIQFNFAEQVWISHSQWHNQVFPWEGPNVSSCRTKYPYNLISSYEYPSKNNVVTNTRIKLKKDSYINTYQKEMSTFYINNPPPLTWNSSTPNYQNFDLNGGLETYWYNWIDHYYDPPTAFNYTIPRGWYVTFPSAGVYTLEYEYWNKLAHPNSSLVTPENSQNLDMYIYSKTPIYVVDCGATEQINTDIISGTYSDKLAGIFEFAGSSAVNVASEANIIFQSCNYIHFKPGLTISSGSNFKAQVTILEADNDQLIRDGLIAENKKNVATENSILLAPNPNNGKFWIKNAMSLEISSIEVLTIDGKKVNCSIKKIDSDYYFEIINPVSSIYLLKFETQHGGIFYKKVICSI